MTADELKAILKKYSALFGINDWSVITINQSFWQNYAWNSETYNNSGSALNLEAMDTIKKYYNEGNEDALIEFLDGLASSFESANKEISDAELISSMLDVIEQNDSLSDEAKEAAKNSVVKGFLDKSRMVPEFELGLTDDQGKPIFDRQVTDDFGNIKELPFSSYFTSGIEGIFNYNMAQSDIIEFQDLLEETGIVADGYFDETKGKPSADLRMEIYSLMLFIDSNLEAHPGTSLRNEIMNNYEPLFFDEFPGGGTAGSLFQQKLLSYYQ